jgi:hypothetical protein
VPHPIVTRRTWLWRAETGAVIEALGFVVGPLSQAGRDWLGGLGPVQEDMVGPTPESPVLGWAGTRPFGPAEAGRLRQVARFAAAPLAALAARAALRALVAAAPAWPTSIRCGRRRGCHRCPSARRYIRRDIVGQYRRCRPA